MSGSDDGSPRENREDEAGHDPADKAGDPSRHRRRITDEEFVPSAHAVRASSNTAGSARVPGAWGCGCTSTRPARTSTSNVGTFSVNGAGDAPVAGWYS